MMNKGLKTAGVLTLAGMIIIAGCAYDDQSAVPVAKVAMPPHPQSQAHSQARLLAQPMPAAMDAPRENTLTEFTDNPVQQTRDNPVSTFSIDVDTVSYSRTRAHLRKGMPINPDMIRVEEMINYFDYDYPAGRSSTDPLAVSVHHFPTPWNDKTRLLHVAMKGFAPQEATAPDGNFVFLIDVSGSMQGEDRLDLVKKSMQRLLPALDADDTVSIIAYSDHTYIALKPTAGDNHAAIKNALGKLEAGGSTNGSGGLEMAYDLAAENFDPDKVNRIFIATDGDFNFGVTHADSIEDLIAEKRETGIYLSVLGYGAGNYRDGLMQSLSQKGNGIAYYVDSLMEANKIFRHDLFKTLYPIANDVKIQVEFNPAQVAEYHMIGYETRQLRREDFKNDKVDAGEIGTGHTVTALYEYVPAGSDFRFVDPLRYQPAKTVESGDISNEIAFVQYRYKLPGTDVSTEKSLAVSQDQGVSTIDQAPGETRFATAVAAFGQILRKSPYTGDYSMAAAQTLARSGRGDDPHGYRSEFIQLMDLAKSP